MVGLELNTRQGRRHVGRHGPVEQGIVGDETVVVPVGEACAKGREIGHQHRDDDGHHGMAIPLGLFCVRTRLG